ncbi:LmeA family phospholipid-binding protein [Pectinatus frisingensis]|uniref:LmeA family phospholipid-binding protein n=1 Tax=Pectinatus frisingensis TaxID=865 RepID=UPI0018C85052|nr:LmeA family phospholipid-binding protein [Pectinatus frisingensis]
MRKILVFVSLLIIALAVFTNMFLPGFISYTIENHLEKDIKAQNLQGEIQTHPAFMIITGRINDLQYRADSAIIGETEVRDVSLTGSNIVVDMPKLLEKQLVVDKAENMTLTCAIDKKSLERLLVKRISRLHNATVEIKPQGITVQADIPLLGNNIATVLQGKLYTKDGNVYFKITEFDVENGLLGKFTIDSKEDILLLDKSKLPFDSKIDSVMQEENQILIKASAHKE